MFIITHLPAVRIKGFPNELFILPYSLTSRLPLGIFLDGNPEFLLWVHGGFSVAQNKTSLTPFSGFSLVFLRKPQEDSPLTLVFPGFWIPSWAGRVPTVVLVHFRMMGMHCLLVYILGLLVLRHFLELFVDFSFSDH